MQSPSSLIFLVLLGVWAAYFAQYWIQRRDHLATARSVEQFSEAMRVLEHHGSRSVTDLSEPGSSSYAGHPTRAARPQVLVARAVATEPSAVDGVTERVASEPPPPGRQVEVRGPAHHFPATGPGPGTGHGRGEGAGRRVGRARRRVRPSRRVRGLVLLAALVELLVIVPLVTLARLEPWALAPASVAVVWAFLWVRAAVRAERAMAGAARRRATRARPSSAAPGAGAAPGAPAARPADRGEQRRRRLPAGDVAGPRGTSPGPEAGPYEGEAPATRRTELPAAAYAGTEVYDGEIHERQAAAAAAVTRATAPVMVPIVDEDDIPLTWDPVPVPRPTYTMKAKAERPEVEPAAVASDSVPAPRGGAGDGTAYDRRRVAGA